MLLVVAGAVAAASTAAIAVAVYFGVFRALNFSSRKKRIVASAEIQQGAATGNANSVESSQVQVQSPAQVETLISNVPIQEAPPPFEEEAVPATPSNSTSIPTDITAVVPISSVAASTSSVVAITAPRRKARSAGKRMPTTPGTGTRRKRAPKPSINTNEPAAASSSTTAISETQAPSVSPAETPAPSSEQGTS